MKTVIRNSGVSLLLAIIFFSAPLHAQEKKSAKALLWKVSGKDLKEPSYLFGTYHLLGDPFLHELPEIKKPFEQAKGIVVELILDSTKVMSMMMLKAMMQGKKISTLLTPAEFQRVDSVLKSASGYGLKMFDTFKPAQVSMVIALSESQKLNSELLQKYKGTPLDIYFAKQGKKLGKTVTPLETMDQQFDMLYNHFTVEEQAKQLVDQVGLSDISQKFTIQMLDLYIKKDIFGLADMMDKLPKEMMGSSDHLLKDRNVNWMKTLPDLMKNGSQFIAVGAAHLMGPDGLIVLLEKEGYTVTPVTK